MPLLGPRFDVRQFATTRDATTRELGTTFGVGFQKEPVIMKSRPCATQCSHRIQQERNNKFQQDEVHGEAFDDPRYTRH
jgi:hypothetical protein